MYHPRCIDDHQIKPNEFEERGVLAQHAAKIPMKVLYGARFLRYDLLRSVCTLAREVTRWTKACDRRPHRLHHQDLSLESFVGDRAKDPTVAPFTDADFAGGIKASKSTSAVHISCNSGTQDLRSSYGLFQEAISSQSQ